MHPEFLPQKELTTGMVGYVLTNMKSSSDVLKIKLIILQISIKLIILNNVFK
jgi:hypothetical protein